MRDLSLRIAGVTMRARTDDRCIDLVAPGAASLFLVRPEQAGDADVDLSVRRADLSQDVAGDALFESGGVWRLERRGDRVAYALRTPLVGSAPYRVALLDERGRGELWIDRGAHSVHAPVVPFEYPLDELLLVRSLERGRGIEIHALGVVDVEGCGSVFVGASGAGKSTLGRLLAPTGVRILSDDRIALSGGPCGITMHGTPWHGEGHLAAPGSAPLTRVWFLRQEPNFQSRPVAPARAAGELFAASFPSFYDQAALAHTLAFIDRIVHETPCAELAFRPEAHVVRHLGFDRTEAMRAAVC